MRLGSGEAGFSGQAPARKPLAGKRILVTRARGQASALVERIQAYGGEAYAFPVITVAPPDSWAPVDEALSSLVHCQWLVITSPNGARHFIGRLLASGRDVAVLKGLKVAAVGATTARTLAELGVSVDVIPREYRGSALPEALGPLLKPGDRILMARGDLADPAHARGLEALGAVVKDLVVYRTVPGGGDPAELKGALAAGQLDYVSFTSSSTVRNLIALLGGRGPLEGVRVAVIGPETRRAAEGEGLTVHAVAQVASVEGLVDAIAADIAATQAKS